MNMRDEMRQMGYSKEDEYFHKQDQELITNMRDSANARKQELEEKHKGQPYWMKCPKCGAELKEETYHEVVKIDICSECGGQFFDRGELDLLLKSRLSAALRGGA
jgi:hypothetical protein